MLDEHAAGLELRIAHHLGDRVDGSGDHAGGTEGVDDVVGPPLRGPFGDDDVDFVLIAAAGDMVDEPFVGGQLGSTHRRAQPAEDGVLIGGDHHPTAVGAAVDVRRRNAFQPSARRPADHSTRVVVGDGGLLHGQAGLGQRHIDDLPLAGDGTAIQRGQRALGGEHSGQGVPKRERKTWWRAAGEAVHVPQTADRLGHRGVTGLVGIRTGLAVAGHSDQNDARVALAQNLITQVPLLQCAGPEVLDDDVAALGEVTEEFPTAGRAQIERDALLVAGVHRPEEMMSVDLGLPPGADRIRRAGWLDLDDLGAHVAEQSGGERPGDQRADFEHPNTVQSTRRRHGVDSAK